jgi:ATP-dependent Clp protease ATP-binding subunit ClpC
VLQLDLPLMIAGAKERGELESRVTRLVAEVREDKDVVLMWVWRCAGAGATGGGEEGDGLAACLGCPATCPP